jgi:1,2-phenylacetyl-CoA epoxidase catalytic subunit
MTDVDAFLAELDASNAAALERIGCAAAAEPDASIGVASLLLLALKNEIEATECAAGWIATTPEIDVKLALARQAGDEARHFRLIQRRLAEIGGDDSGTRRAGSTFDPGPPSPMLTYLSLLETTVERVAAGQFTREALAVVRNEEFIRFCVSRGDETTAALYRDVIQPDERHHHELGRSLLAKLAVDDATQEAARRAAKKTLDLAEELQEIARMKRGVSRAPGC